VFGTEVVGGAIDVLIDEDDELSGGYVKS